MGSSQSDGVRRRPAGDRASKAAKARQAAAMALAPMLEPLVDVCLELGITSPEMERLLRTVFVSRAHKLLSGNARRARSPSDVRIGLMIGVHRNFVREIRTTR